MPGSADAKKFFFFVHERSNRRHVPRMSSRPLTVLPPPPPDGPGEYATSDEARAAIMQLTGAELTKLQFVAEIHCRHYAIPEKHMEPTELLHEAFRRTLDLTKQWRKAVKLHYHLDRAMENIAGHEVPKLKRRVEVGGNNDDEEADGEDPLDGFQKPRSADETVVAKVHARENLQQLEETFQDDKTALDVLMARARGQEGKEIQETLNLTKKDYDAISKRILRKLKSHYYEPRSQAVPPGRGA